MLTVRQVVDAVLCCLSSEMARRQLALQGLGCIGSLVDVLAADVACFLEGDQVSVCLF